MRVTFPMVRLMIFWVLVVLGDEFSDHRFCCRSNYPRGLTKLSRDGLKVLHQCVKLLQL